MGRATVRGIYPGKDDRWHVDKVFRGHRLPRRSFPSQGEAESWVLEQIAKLKGRPPGSVPTFNQAAAHYVLKNEDKASIELDLHFLGQLMPYIGELALDQIDDEALEPFVAAMQAGKPPATKPLKNHSINLALERVRMIVNLASRKWRKDGKYWLQTLPPTITMLDEDDARPPMQLAWRQQREHLKKLPQHLARMALFALNTGARDDPVCNLQWEWEVQLREHGFSVFVVPREHVKGRKRERVLVCNSVAQSIIESCRGEHPTHVFTYTRLKKDGSVAWRRPITGMDNTAWQKWRARWIPGFRVHDLRHTVGMRLREAGVSEATRDEILWHNGRGMSTHYAVAQVLEVRQALELITDERYASNVSLASLIREKRALPGKVPTPKKLVA